MTRREKVEHERQRVQGVVAARDSITRKAYMSLHKHFSHGGMPIPGEEISYITTDSASGRAWIAFHPSNKIVEVVTGFERPPYKRRSLFRWLWETLFA